MRYPLPVPPRPPCPPRTALAAFAILLIGGCAVEGPKVDPVYLANVADLPDETRTEVVGDWDDLNAALGVGLGKLNLAVVDSGEPSDRVVTLSLVDVLDRPARLSVERLHGGPGDVGPATIRISAAFLRARDRDRERLLVGAVAQRFGELRGVDVAPAR